MFSDRRWSFHDQNTLNQKSETFKTLNFMYFQFLMKYTTTGWAKKTAHGFLCYNFAYSQSFFIIFGTLYTIGNLQLGDA